MRSPAIRGDCERGACPLAQRKTHRAHAMEEACVRPEKSMGAAGSLIDGSRALHSYRVVRDGQR